MAFAEIAKWNHFIFLQNDGLPGFLLNSFLQLRASNGLLIVWSPWKSVWHFSDIIHFVHTQFLENLSVFPWHQNYGFCRDREMKSFYFSPKWRSSGLPIEFFCVTAGFQRSSYCVKTVEVRLAICFNIIHFVDTQFRENLSVFPWHQNYGFCRYREMTFFSKMTVFRASYWILLYNCGLPTVFLLCEARGSPFGIFLCNTFSRYSVSRNLSVFPWHKIMAFTEIAKWNNFIFLQNDGLPSFLLNSFV